VDLLTYAIVVLVVLAACFTQSLSGFGSALVAMPVLVPLLDGAEISRAAPLMVLVAGTLQIILLVRLRKSMNLGTVWRLAIPSLLFVPVGMLGRELVPEAAVLAMLGAVVALYALYALSRPRLPRLKSRAWAYLAGAVSGVLGGAYTTNGPPVIVYGSCRGWEPRQFRSNLQGFFVINNVMILACHLLRGNVTGQVLRLYLAALPAVLAAIVLAALLERRINPELFRKIILVMLVLLGASLVARAAM
jgi:uncharacterized membrane protein YfcA